MNDHEIKAIGMLHLAQRSIERAIIGIGKKDKFYFEDNLDTAIKEIKSALSEGQHASN